MNSECLHNGSCLHCRRAFLCSSSRDRVVFATVGHFLHKVNVNGCCFLCVCSVPFVMYTLAFVGGLGVCTHCLFPTFLLSFVFFGRCYVQRTLNFSFIFVCVCCLFRGSGALGGRGICGG